MSVSNAHITFQQQLNILVYAVRATELFTNGDIREVVINCGLSRTSVYLRNLVNAGYLEKVTCIRYRATPYAKQLLGAQ